MGKKLSIGVSNVARKGKKAWVGVDSKSRKIKKMWIGDASGKARCFFSGSGLFTLSTVNNDAVSDDLVSWTTKTRSFTLDGTHRSISGNGVVVKALKGGTIYYSKDGFTWTKTSITSSYADASSIIPSLHFCNKMFIAVFYNTVWTSNNGANWTKKGDISWGKGATNAMKSRIVYGKYNNDYYYAVGVFNHKDSSSAGDSILVSKDLINWSCPHAYSNYMATAYAHTVFVVNDEIYWAYWSSGTGCIEMHKLQPTSTGVQFLESWSNSQYANGGAPGTFNPVTNQCAFQYTVYGSTSYCYYDVASNSWSSMGTKQRPYKYSGENLFIIVNNFTLQYAPATVGFADIVYTTTYTSNSGGFVGYADYIE